MKKSFCIWILCSLLIMLFAATVFAATGEKRVVLGIERIDEPFAKQLLAGKGWDCLLISPVWTASFAAAQSCCRRAII